MRVLLAPSAFFPSLGGVEELTLKLGQHLQMQGHRVTVVTNRWPNRPPEHEVVDGLTVYRLDFVLAGRRPLSWWRYQRSLAAHLELLRNEVGEVDVVHAQCLSSQLPVVARYARLCRASLVLTTQGEVAMDAGRLYQSSAFMRSTLRREAKRAAVLTGCSRWTLDATSKVAPAFRDADVVLNGVDTDDWMAPPPPTEPVVCAWGRLVPQKGFDLLLRAFPIVRQALPGARLLLGGDGPERQVLASLATPGVELLGALDRGQVRQLLGGSRIAVVPSRIEPFGIVAIEALAAGRGLVYAADTGLAEAAGRCGRGVDVNDASALAAAIIAELRAPTPSDKGVARAKELSWSRISRQYLKLYER